ncbi:MAG: rhomboid family intramembrane serine protease [Planctomycetaceae bacterium]
MLPRSIRLLFRRTDKATVLLTVLCFLWSAPLLLGWLDPRAAGALSRVDLWEGRPWRLVTAIFLHAGPLHLLLNGISLVAVGSIVENECGRRPLLLLLFGSAVIGSLCSLLFFVPQQFGAERMGISGGISGLVGGLFALEWGRSRSAGEFVRSLRVQILFVLVVLTVLLALKLPTLAGAQIDNAAHLGGFCAGLLAGLGYFGRRGRSRPWLALLLALAPAIPLALLAATPADPLPYKLHRAAAAEDRGDRPAAEALYDDILVLDPGHPLASARLAALRLDPAPLLAMRPLAMGDEAAREALLEAHRRLAGRFTRESEPSPETAARLRDAYDRGARMLLAVDGGRWAWPAAAEALRWRIAALRHASSPPLTPEEALLIVQEAVLAGRGFGASPPPPDALLEQLEGALAEAAAVASPAAEAALEQSALLADALGELFKLLAANTAREPLVPRYLYLRGVWAWRGMEGRGAGEAEREELLAVLRAAHREALRLEDPVTVRLTERWFAQRGLPPPG